MRFDRRHLAQYAVFTAALVGLAIYLATQMNHSGSPFASRYTVRAEFRNADVLLKDEDVRLRGVQIGKVGSVDPAPDGNVVVSMLIDSADRLHADATARVRPYTLIGDKYVEVDPGTATAPVIPSGGMIPSAQTSVPVEIYELLNVLDKSTRAKVDFLLQEGGAALRGQGTTVNQLLTRLPHVERTLASTLLVLDARAQTVDHLLASADGLLTSLAASQTRLDAAVNASDRVVGALADDRDVITQLVAQADRGLNTLATAIAGEGDDARAMVASAPGLLDELQSFLQVADGDVRGVSPESAQIRGLLGQLRSSFSAQDANGYYLRVYDRYDCSTVATTSAAAPHPCSYPNPSR
jgi:phospholipid/cholesterol/gamma-HCH transport system substrate-binding protein